MTFDLLRGYFLVGILFDHLAFFPSGLGWWSGRGGLLVTMAEGFFLISGIILGIVRGAKLVDYPFKYVAKLLLKRGLQIYIVAVALALLFTGIGWLFYMHNDGLKPGIAPLDTPLWQLLWNALTFQYLYGWADYLRLYAVFLFVSPLVMWLLRRGWWYVVLALSLGVWALFPSTNGMSFDEQEKLQLLSWQVLFYGGMTIGFYWPKILDWWRSRSQRVRQVIATSVVTLAVMTLLYNVLILLAVMGYDTSWSGASAAMNHYLFDNFFNKQRLPLTRIALFLLWFAAAFYLVRRHEKKILRVLGWLLVPFGVNSLYVYTIEAFFIFFIDLYLKPGGIVLNFLVSVIPVLIILMMIRYKVLMRVIPR